MFIYTRLTIIPVQFRRLAMLYFATRKVGKNVVIRAREGCNLQCSNVARQGEEKCCPRYRGLLRRITKTISVKILLEQF